MNDDIIGARGQGRGAAARARTGCRIPVAPEPDLAAVSPLLRDLHALYAGDDEAPDHLAELVRRVSDAYQLIDAADADAAWARTAGAPDGGTPRRHG